MRGCRQEACVQRSPNSGLGPEAGSVVGPGASPGALRVRVVLRHPQRLRSAAGSLRCVD